MLASEELKRLNLHSWEEAEPALGTSQSAWHCRRHLPDGELGWAKALSGGCFSARGAFMCRVFVWRVEVAEGRRQASCGGQTQAGHVQPSFGTR